MKLLWRLSEVFSFTWYWLWSACMSVLVTRSCPSLCAYMDCSLPGSFVHMDSRGKNTGVDCHFLLQGFFPTQGSNPVLPHDRQILYHLSHQGSPCRGRCVSNRTCVCGCVVVAIRSMAEGICPLPALVSKMTDGGTSWGALGKTAADGPS